MFTGIVESTGRVCWIRKSHSGIALEVEPETPITDPMIGESISVNGCCLTLIATHQNRLSFDILEESLKRTNLQFVRTDDTVNLERSLLPTTRLGGHFLQGHVDCVSPVLSFQKVKADYRLEIALPREFSHLVVLKGSIAINGVSLTIAEILPDSIVIWIIPHTYEITNLASLTPTSHVNIEFDILGKYIARIHNKDGRYSPSTG